MQTETEMELNRLAKRHGFDAVELRYEYTSNTDGQLIASLIRWTPEGDVAGCAMAPATEMLAWLR